MAKTKAKATPKKKYDWPKLKQEFMVSDHLTSTAFFRNEYGTEIDKNGTVKRNVIGWTEEKEEFHRSIYEKTMELLEGKEAKENAKALIDLMQSFRDDLKTENIKELSVAEKERLWHIFMTMNNRPTKYTENLNKNLNTETRQLTPEEKASLSKKLSENGLV